MRWGILLVFALVCLSLPIIGLSSIGGSSEAREAHVTKVILESGEWILPRRNGLIPSKPPLYHWCSAIISKGLGGVSEFSSRVPSLLFGTGMLLVTTLHALYFAKVTLLKNTRDSELIALWSGIILSSMYGFQRMITEARVDVTFSFFVTWAIFVILAIPHQSTNSSLLELRKGHGLRLSYFYLLCGFAVLSKGPLGLILPLLIGGGCFWFIYGLRPALKFFLRPCWGWLVFLVVALPWYVAAFLKGEGGFLERQLIFENILRFVGGSQVNKEDFWFYLPSFIRTAFPWSLVLIFVLGRYALSLYSRYKLTHCFGSEKNKKLIDLYVLWFGIGFLFFSCASGKRHAYLIPLYPPVSIYLSLCLYKWWSSLSDLGNMRVRVIASCVWLMMGALSISILIVVSLASSSFLHPPEQVGIVLEEARKWLSPYLIRFQIILMIPIILSLVAFIWQKSLTWKTRIFLIWFLGMSIYISVLNLGMGIKNHLKGFDVMAKEVNKLVPKNTRLVVYRTQEDELMDPLLYYLGRTVLIEKPTYVSPCSQEMNTHALFLAKDDYYENLFMQEDSKNLNKHAVLKQRLDSILGKTIRDLVLFSCES